ncbi:MAG: hypothetical protein Q9160_004083 [Pyrenula sp. 1 TL-2023]
MFSLTSLALISSSSLFSALVSAVPDVTAVPLPNDCSSYPGYNPSTGTAGPWIVQVVESGNSSIEGFGDTVEISRGATGIRWGYITFPTRNTLAKTALQCTTSPTPGQLSALAPTVSSVSGSSFQPLLLSPIPYDSSLIYGVQGGPPVLPFAHYTPNAAPDGSGGERIDDGVYLGGGPSYTTWGLRYEESANVDGNPFFYARLLGEGSGDPVTGERLGEGEFEAFVRIVA